MYMIKYQNTIVYLTGDPDHVAYDVKLSLEANKAGSLTFTVPKSRNLSIPKLQPYLTVYEDAEILWKGRVISTELDFYENTVYTCEGFLAVLNDSLSAPYEHHGTVEQLFSKLIADHNNSIYVYEVNASPTWEEDRWYWLNNGSYVLITTETDFNAKIASSTKIFEITDRCKEINVGTISSGFDENNYIYRYWESYKSVWELLNSELVDSFGGYLRLRYESTGVYLDWKSETDLTAESGQIVLLGENLSDLTKFIDATGIYTACIPIGAEITEKTWAKWDYSSGNPEWQDAHWYTQQNTSSRLDGSSGQTSFNSAVSAQSDLYEIESEEATGTYTNITSVEASSRTPKKYLGQNYLLATQTMIDAYGIVYAPIDETTWDDVTTPSNLLTKAINYMDNQAVMLSNEIEITFADLSKLMDGYDDVRLLDKIRVISDYHGLKKSDDPYRVLRITYNLDAPETSSITIGNTTLSLTDKTVQQKRDIETISKTVEVINTEKASTEKLEREIQTVNKTITDTAESLGVRIQGVSERAGTIEEKVSDLTIESGRVAVEISTKSSTAGSVGWTTSQINTFFNFGADGMEIGRSNSLSKLALDNKSVKVKVSGVSVAEFEENNTHSRNFKADNQVNINDKWALRITSDGNLNDIWIGGAV